MILNQKTIIKSIGPYAITFIITSIFYIIIMSNIIIKKQYNHKTKTINTINNIVNEKQNLLNDFKYINDATKIMDYYYKNNICMRLKTVTDMLKAIDKYLPKYFKENEFSRNDFIALALTETTNLNQYTIGSCGEYGLFQIMPEMCEAFKVKKNHFDIFVNTELAMFVLSDKFKQHNDYYKAIIAYNGVIIDPNTKRWRDKYWQRFLSYKKDIDIIFGE